jgi:glycosyltransferase involved in cell wall biosynthesis
MKKIHVGCDSFVFRMQNYGGVTNVIENLYNELNDVSEYGVKLSFYEAIPPNWATRLGSSSVRERTYVLDRIKEKLFPLDFKKHQEFDFKFLGYHYDPLQSSDQDIPLISMVYDFIPERFPEFFTGGSPHLDKLDILKRTSLAVCISEQTRRDLFKYVPDFSGEAVVIPLASKFPLTGQEKVLTIPPSPYLLYVGRRDAYKNTDLILQSMRFLPDLHLVLFGGGELTSFELDRVGKESFNRVHCITGDDSILQAYYQGAMALIFPSKIEGFGLPILEAMSLGCPVIASDIPVFVELFGNAIAYFDPNDVHSLTLAIEKFYYSERAKAEFIERGLKVSREFTWRKAAEIFSQACKNLINS